MTTVMLFCALVGVMNLIVDVAYVIVDPRIRLTR